MHHFSKYGGTMKTPKSMGILLFLCCLAAVSILMQPNTHGQKRSRGKEVFTGTAVAIGGQFGGASRPFTLEITSYTADDELQRDFQVLRTQGQDAFLKAIGPNKLGSFAFDGQTGRDLNFVQESQTGNGRKITILSERWLNMFELRYGTRSQDYPFTYIELFINDNGKGEGSLIGLAKVYFDKENANTLEIENFGTYPAKLMGVELRTR
jgi:hypothetical protein